jgi:hypothetical protein
MILVYRVPAKPTAGRVAVWRQLKKVGAIYLQQSVCVFPDNATVKRDLAPILSRVTDAAGEYHLLPLRQLDDREEHKLIEQFLAQTSKHYQEIIENCEINFTKEVEFETFRENFTYEEAEEIRLEFDKIRAWFERVSQRDWFGATNRDEALEWIARCERLLEQFEAKVFEVQDRAAGHLTKGSRKRSPSSNSSAQPMRELGLADARVGPRQRRAANVLPLRRAGPAITHGTR